jgi:hypothetical protein
MRTFDVAYRITGRRYGVRETLHWNPRYDDTAVGLLSSVLTPSLFLPSSVLLYAGMLAPTLPCLSPSPEF